MVALGTEIKFGIRFPQIDGVHFEDCDFEVSVYVYTNKSVTYKKGDEKHIKKMDEDSYKVVMTSDDALKIGRGHILATLTIHIPDGDFEDGYRTEVYDKLDTQWVIM